MASAAKVLSVGLGDLVSSRNAALRSAGFDVIAAITLEEVFQQCVPARFDVAIVGHAFSLRERAQFVRCIQSVFRLPVILIAEDEVMTSIQADSHIRVDAPAEELVCAIHRIIEDNRSPAMELDRAG